MTRFEGRTAVVTGGASGIGKAIAVRLSGEGARIAIGDLVDATPVVSELPHDAIAVIADVTTAAGVDRLVAAAEERFGPPDVLVNNSGGTAGGDLLAVDEPAWDRDIAVNLRAAWLCTKRVLPAMIERSRGVIVNIASVNALTYLGDDAYSAAKAGMLSLTRGVAVRYGRHGIRCVAVAPGTIRTPVWQDRVDREPETLDRLADWYPLGRVGEPEDVAAAVAFLSSDEASWITGTTLCVDGGLLAGSAAMTGDLGAGR